MVPSHRPLSSSYESLASYLERTELLPPAEAASLADVIQRYSDRFSSGQDVDETFQYLRSLGVRNLPDILKHYTFVVDMTKAQLQEKVEWIKQHRGLTELEIGHIISHAPRMLVKQAEGVFQDVEEFLQVNLKFEESSPLLQALATKLLVRYPQVMLQSVSFVPGSKLLISHGLQMDENALQRVFISCPSVFTLSSVVMSKRVEKLFELFPEPGAACQVFKQNPGVLLISRLDQKLGKLQSFFLTHGWESSEQVMGTLQSFPQLLTKSEADLKRPISFLQKLLKTSGLEEGSLPSILSKHPCILVADLAKLRRRTSYLVFHLGVDLTQCDFFAILAPSEELFCSHVLQVGLREYLDTVSLLTGETWSPLDDDEKMHPEEISVEDLEEIDNPSQLPPSSMALGLNALPKLSVLPPKLAKTVVWATAPVSSAPKKRVPRKPRKSGVEVPPKEGDGRSAPKRKQEKPQK